MLENSNMFSTKLTIELSDCKNTVVMTSEEGKSRIKDFKKGHQDALRKAFQSIQTMDYKYNKNLARSSKREEPKTNKEIEVKETQNEVVKVEQKQKLMKLLRKHHQK